MIAYDEQAWWNMVEYGENMVKIWFNMIFMVKNLVGKPGNHEVAESRTTNELIRRSIKSRKSRTEN